MPGPCLPAGTHQKAVKRWPQLTEWLGWPWLGQCVTGPCGWSCSGPGLGAWNPPFTVPRGERKQLCLQEKARPLMLASSLPGDRGPLLGKTGSEDFQDLSGPHPPATHLASANSQQLLPVASCPSVRLLVCVSLWQEAQDSSFKAKPLSSQPHSQGRSPGGCPSGTVSQVTWVDTQVLPSCRAQPGPTRRPPTSGDTWGGGSVRSRPAGASRGDSLQTLRPRGTEKDIASHVGKKGGGRGRPRQPQGPLLPRSPMRPPGSAVTKLLLPGHMVQPVGPSGVGRRAHVWPALTPAHPHMFLHVHLYHWEGPRHQHPCTWPLPTSDSHLLGAGAQLAPLGAGRAGLCEPPCPARLGRATGCLVLGSGGDCSPPARTGERPTPAQGQSACSSRDLHLLGGWVSQGRQGGGRGVPRLAP